MASAIEDVSNLPGETLKDQDGRKIGEIKEIYAVGDNETPMWVTVESETGLGRSKRLFVPLARIKQQNDEIRVPYSFQHLHEAPDVEEDDQLSQEDDKALRNYYSVGLADQEMVDNRQSYASQVPDEDGPAKPIDAEAAEGPVRELDERPSAERAAEAYDERQKESSAQEHEKGRKATASDVMDENSSNGDGGSEEKEEEA
jgi:PRC-barrel domain